MVGFPKVDLYRVDLSSPVYDAICKQIRLYDPEPDEVIKEIDRGESRLFVVDGASSGFVVMRVERMGESKTLVLVTGAMRPVDHFLKWAFLYSQNKGFEFIRIHTRIDKFKMKLQKIGFFPAEQRPENETVLIKEI